MHESIDFRTNKIKRGANSPCRKFNKTKTESKKHKNYYTKNKDSKTQNKKKMNEKNAHTKLHKYSAHR